MLLHLLSFVVRAVNPARAQVGPAVNNARRDVWPLSWPEHRALFLELLACPVHSPAQQQCRALGTVRATRGCRRLFVGGCRSLGRAFSKFSGTSCHWWKYWAGAALGLLWAVVRMTAVADWPHCLRRHLQVTWATPAGDWSHPRSTAC